MSYGELKIDTITFTAGGVDASVSVSGLVQNPTFTGNITTTGTISGDVIKGNTVSGATVTGDTGEFGNLTAVSGVFTLKYPVQPLPVMLVYLRVLLVERKQLHRVSLRQEPKLILL
jgi:hypothetical protein